MSTNNITNTPLKSAAVDFLQMVVAGKIRDAYDKHISRDFNHHNPYFKGDRRSLMEAMEDADRQQPHKTLDVQRVLEDGDIVAVHSRLSFAGPMPDMSVVHIFRFSGEKAVELWDIAMQAPAESPNENGMF